MIHTEDDTREQQLEWITEYSDRLDRIYKPPVPKPVSTGGEIVTALAIAGAAALLTIGAIELLK